MALDPLVSETAKKWQSQLASARTVVERLVGACQSALPRLSEADDYAKKKIDAALAAASAWLAGQKGE